MRDRALQNAQQRGSSKALRCRSPDNMSRGHVGRAEANIGLLFTRPELGVI
jgi:hypothetical protein